MGKIDIPSPHSADECVARLRALVATTHDIHGRAAGSSIRLRVSDNHWNAFKPVLSGRFVDHDGGAWFQGRVGIPPATLIFVAVWFIALALFGSLAVIKEIRSSKGDWSLVIPIVAAVMIGFGLFSVRVSRRLARDEPRRLVEFVRSAIDAPPPCRAP